MRKLLLLLCLFGFTHGANASPGHDHGEGAFASGVAATHFELTKTQFHNLEIQTMVAQKVPMSNTVDMLSFTALLPERSAIISSHFEGRITAINIKIGQEIEKGHPLATLQPVNVGTQAVTLYAPISGYVVNLKRNIGEIVQSGDSIMQLGDPSQMLVKGILYETPAIQNIKVGQDIDFHLDIDPEKHYTGQVQRINRVIDPENRTFSIYALIDTPQGELSSGLQGIMEVFTGSDAPVLAVPKRAVLGDVGQEFVYVINGLEVNKRMVKIGARNSYHTEILEGVEENEEIVTQGNYQLQYLSVSTEHHDHHDNEHHDGEQNNLHENSAAKSGLADDTTIIHQQ